MSTACVSTRVSNARRPAVLSARPLLLRVAGLLLPSCAGSSARARTPPSAAPVPGAATASVPAGSAGPEQCPSWESVAAVGRRKVTTVDTRTRTFLADPGALSCTYTGSGRNTEITIRNTSHEVAVMDADLLRTQHRAGLASISGEPLSAPPPGLAGLQTTAKGECTVVLYAAAGPSAFVLVDAFQTDADADSLCPDALRLAAARFRSAL